MIKTLFISALLYASIMGLWIAWGLTHAYPQ
jgi:hypothetical protein